MKIILAWVVVSVVVAAFSPRLTDIINADQTSFLPDSEEAFTDAERIVGTATVVLIVGLQLLIFRSPSPPCSRSSRWGWWSPWPSR